MPAAFTRRGEVDGSALAKLRFLLGIAIAEGQAPLLLPDPVLAVRHAAAEAFVIVLELLCTALLPVEEGPPGRLRLAAVKADEIGHELPRLGIGRLRIGDERGLERRLRALPRLPLGLLVRLEQSGSARGLAVSGLAPAASGRLPWRAR